MIGKEINAWLSESKISGELLVQPYNEKPVLDNRETTLGYLGASFPMSEKLNLEKIINYFSNAAATFKCILAFGIFKGGLDSAEDLLFFGPFSLVSNEVNIQKFHELLLE